MIRGGSPVLAGIYKLIASGEVADMRRELRSSGATPEEIAAATEKMVRHYLEPLVPDERFWPVHLTLARCAYCNGTGLVIHRNVENKLKCTIDDGTPCRCPLGARFLPKIQEAGDHLQAGKVKKHGMTGFGGKSIRYQGND